MNEAAKADIQERLSKMKSVMPKEFQTQIRDPERDPEDEAHLKELGYILNSLVRDLCDAHKEEARQHTYISTTVPTKEGLATRRLYISTAIKERLMSWVKELVELKEHNPY